MPQAQLGREIGSFITLHSANPLVGKVRRNSEPCFFNEETLHFIQCPGMFGSRPYIFVVRWWKSPLLETVQMLVNSSNTVFPKLVFPFGSRQIIFQDPFVSVKSHHLACFLFQCHLAEQIFYACIDRCCRVFVSIFDSILIEVYPSFLVHFRTDGFINSRYSSCFLCREECTTS